MIPAAVNAAKLAINFPDMDDDSPCHQNLPFFEELSNRDYTMSLLLVVIKKHNNCFPIKYDTRKKKARLLLHLSDTLLFKITNASPENAKALIVSYANRGNINSIRTTAFAPICSHVQLFDSSMLVKHFLGTRNDEDVRYMVGVY